MIQKNAAKNSEVISVSLKQITVNATQPRSIKDPQAVRQLADNMSELGLISPIEVDENCVIVTGESRFEAAKLLGWSEIAARVVPRDINTFARQVSENVVRRDMEPMDVAIALAKMCETRSKMEVAKLLGWNASTVGHYMGLLKVTDERLLKMLSDKTLHFRSVNAIDKCQSQEVREEMIKLAEEGLARQWVVISRAMYFLIATRNFKTCREILAEAKEKKLPELKIVLKFDQIHPSAARQFGRNLEPGQRLIAAMSNLSLAMKETSLKDVAPLHYGRLMTTYEILMAQMPKFHSQLLVGGEQKQI